MSVIRCALVAALTLVMLATAPPARADGFADLLQGLNVKGFKNVGAAVDELAAAGDPRAVPVLEALADGALYVRKTDKTVFIVARAGDDFALTDPLTGEAAGTAPRADFKKVKTNNRLRRQIRTALGGLGLFAPDAARRADAARALFKSPDATLLPLVERALESETDDAARAEIELARAAIVVRTGADAPAKIAAIAVLAEATSQEVRALLGSVLVAGAENAEVRAAATEALERIDERLALLGLVQNVFQGISLGSVLLLAAIGLAITFGVMGVINMAHGEMVMLGAYATFMVQEAFRAWAPGAFDWSLAVAIPAAFLVAGGVGVAIERGIIRFLYGRPLETLLATWGLSLILQQLVRTVFGPTNQEVGAPAWMSGAIEITGGLALTVNRLWIVGFSLVVLFALMALLRFTTFGLQLRAVTQNRRMADAMGIRSGWVDALTFGLGSGIAGMAGVALSQIDNVSPNLGQSYIIDSFMVVVFGGVGNLWGTLVGAMSLGVVNKFLEPVSGAVLAKIIVLVAIILFIQKRPRGLFAPKGRAVES